LDLQKKLSKKNIEIINSIELICVININKIDDYKKFLLKELSKNNKLNNYLKNFWFTKNNKEYNFSEFIEKYKKDKNKIKMIYLTNNIVESINSKLSYYLPKRITNEYNFIKSINNILINDAIDNDNKNKIYDFKTQSLLLLIEKEGINKKFKWINFAQFKFYLNLIVKDNHIENIEGESENYLN
jgi:hypothetical protein